MGKIRINHHHEWRQYLAQPNIHKSGDKEKLVIEIADDSEHEWVERIGNAAYVICNDPARNRIKLNEQYTE